MQLAIKVLLESVGDSKLRSFFDNLAYNLIGDEGCKNLVQGNQID